MNRQIRNRKAVTILEMVMGLIVVIPLILILIDMVLIGLAVQVNDNAAREADRVAASGDPNQAAARAQQVITRLNANTGGFCSNLTLAPVNPVTFSPSNLLTVESSLVPYGGVVQGSVTVQTQVTVRPFVISIVNGGPYVFQSKQTCPVTYVVPNTAGGQAVPP